MNWLECVELKSAIAEEDVRFSLKDTLIPIDAEASLIIYTPKDFNCDEVVTISDVWEGIKWLVHVPGDALVSWVTTPGMMQFLELGDTPYGTYFSTGLGWFIVIWFWFVVIAEGVKR